MLLPFCCIQMDEFSVFSFSVTIYIYIYIRFEGLCGVSTLNRLKWNSVRGRHTFGRVLVCSIPFCEGLDKQERRGANQSQGVEHRTDRSIDAPVPRGTQEMRAFRWGGGPNGVGVASRL